MFYEFQHLGQYEYVHKEYGENFSFPKHLHQAFEFITILSGQMTVIVNENVYELTEGESMMIFPNQVHSLSSSSSKHMLCIFSPELVQAYTVKIIDKLPKKNIFRANYDLIHRLDLLKEESSIIEKKGLLYSLCAEFDQCTEYIDQQNDENQLLYEIFKFVELNYDKDCSLHNLTKNVGFSYCYLSRYFKNIVGISYNEYVNLYRLSNACYLLNNSDCTVLQCALESGYGSLRSFNRNFLLHLHITPTEYKNHAKK